MMKLHPNWITEGRIDFEYKKYILLAYLQEVNRNFNTNKLYPFLSELAEHYRNISRLKENANEFKSTLPKYLSGLDLKTLSLKFESMLLDEGYMEEVSQIIDFAIPQMKTHLDDGRNIFEFVESKIHIEPVGIIPLNKDFGYFFIKQNSSSRLSVYNYNITLYESAEEKFKGIRTQKMDEREHPSFHSYEGVKHQLIKENSNYPNPATFIIESELQFPEEETLLPVSRRILIRYISNY